MTKMNMVKEKVKSIKQRKQLGKKEVYNPMNIKGKKGRKMTDENKIMEIWKKPTDKINNPIEKRTNDVEENIESTLEDS